MGEAITPRGISPLMFTLRSSARTRARCCQERTRAAPQSSPSSTRQLFRIRFASSVLGRRRSCGAALSVFEVCFLCLARLLLLHVSGLLLARSRSYGSVRLGGRSAAG